MLCAYLEPRETLIFWEECSWDYTILTCGHLGQAAFIIIIF